MEDYLAECRARVARAGERVRALNLEWDQTRREFETRMAQIELCMNDAEQEQNSAEQELAAAETEADLQDAWAESLGPVS